MTPDPTLLALTSAARDDPAARGPLADWLEERGEVEAAALARWGKVNWAREMVNRPDGRISEVIHRIGRFVIESGCGPDGHTMRLRRLNYDWTASDVVASAVIQDADGQRLVAEIVRREPAPPG